MVKIREIKRRLTSLLTIFCFILEEYDTKDTLIILSGQFWVIRMGTGYIINLLDNFLRTVKKV